MKFVFILFTAHVCFAYSESYDAIIKQALGRYAFLRPALSIEIKNDTSSFAAAESDGSKAQVTISTGLLNSPMLTEDGLRLILCHELGHIYGGAPRRHIPFEWEGPTATDGLSFSSSEGQADYYATVSCFSVLTQNQDHTTYLKSTSVPESINQSCVHLDSHNQLICQRAILASLNFLNLNLNLNLSVDKPDPFIAPILIQDQYPSAQCRLDTFIAGARCPIKKPLILDFVHSNGNDCAQTAFARPACWYQSN